MGSGASKKEKTVNISSSDRFLSPEENEIQAPDGDFNPNYAEFPSPMTLRHENIRYWKWKQKNPQAKPLHQGYPDPDIVRKKDVFRNTTFIIADQQAVYYTPREYLWGVHLEDLVTHLVSPFYDEMNKARVIFRWICAQDFGTELEEWAKVSAYDYLIRIRHDLYTYPEFYDLMCGLAGLDSKVITGFRKNHYTYTLGNDIEFNYNSNWNAVKINRTWHLVDMSSAALSLYSSSSSQKRGWELLDNNGQGYQVTEDEEPDETVVIPSLNEYYFLPDPEEFIYNHFPEDEGWQLLARPVTKQEFTNMARLTRAFFEMGLDCSQERKCVLQSQSQETILKLGFPKSETRKFSYQLWKSSDDKNWDFEAEPMARFVFLEQHEGTLTIKVVYPVTGKYQLTLRVCDGLTGTEIWYMVAEYLLICDNKKERCTALPPNSRFEWGPGQDTQKLGMTAVTHPHGTIETDDGEAEVVFNLSNLVDILTKLRNDSQEEELLEQSIMHRIEDSNLIINARLQAQGTYALDIYAKEKGEGGNPVMVCTYLVNTSSPVLEPFKFPKLHQQTSGPTEEFAKFHIVPVSHRKTYFTSKEGFENILFKYSSKLNFMAQLEVDHGEGNEEVENHTFIEQTDSTVTFKVRFPKAGIYNLKMFAKEQADPGLDQPVYNYIIHVPVRMKDCSPFPIQYLRLGCKVDGLESGYLVEQEDITVELVIPGAKAVAAIKDGKSTNFSKGPNGKWTGVVNTGKAGQNVQLSAQFEGSKSFDCLFEYQVKEKEYLETMKHIQEEQLQKEQKEHDERELEKIKKAEKFEKLQKDLRDAIQTEDFAKLQETVDQVEKWFYTNKLREDYLKAKALIKSLERVEKMKKSILQMNHSTMAEIRSYNHPPEGIHEIMTATLLLLGKDESTTKDWRQCQALCNTSVLSKEVGHFNVKELHPEIAARARVLLQTYRIDDIAVKSAGAAAFYRWVVGMTDELDQLTEGGTKKASPAGIRRQKEIFNQL